MSEVDSESLKEFLRGRKIDLGALDPKEQDKFDIDQMEAKHIEYERAKAFPISSNEALTTHLEVTSNILDSIFGNCFEM